MFKKLKRKLLTLNLSILTILLLIVFSTLYITNYQNIQRTIEFELNMITENDTIIGGSLPHDIPNPNLEGNRNISFVIVTDLSGTVTEQQSNFGADDDIFSEALILVDDTLRGTIELDGSYWSYRVVTYGDFVTYGFLDTTSEQAYLSTMLYSFIGVFLISVVALFVISNYFTNRSVQGIKEAFLKQKQFIADASHELKTPLAIISTNTDILMETDKENKWLHNIRYEADRMNKLTKDLLYLTKMSEQVPDEIIKSRINLSELTESTILTFEALAYTKNIDIKYDLAPEVFADVDENQFSQVLHILLDNAVKYTPEAGKIDVKLEYLHNYIVYSVRNTGEGISSEDIKNIFDRFYMGDKSRSANEKSYGLGLSIAKTILDNHQAKFSCESTVGESTTFYIKFKNKYL